MKKIFVFALIAVLYFAGFSTAAEGERYIGIKGGNVMIDIDDSDFDDITALGVVYGQSLGNNLWVEGEFNNGISGGEFDETYADGFGTIGLDAEVDTWTVALYAAYRFPLNDAVYLKGKAGLLYESVEFEGSISCTGAYAGIPPCGESWSDDESDTGLSFGVGGGFNISDQISAEVEYTVIESDVDYLSFGLNYKF